jgi:hypothetical protein
MEPETRCEIPPVYFPEVASGTDHATLIEMYDALFHSVALTPEYCDIESAVPPFDA